MGLHGDRCSRLHHHTHGDHGVVLEGTLALEPEGQARRTLARGSYFSMAGGVKHETACEAGADCVFFVHREGAFDAVMAGAATPKAQ